MSSAFLPQRPWDPGVFILSLSINHSSPPQSTSSLDLLFHWDSRVQHTLSQPLWASAKIKASELALLLDSGSSCSPPSPRSRRLAPKPLEDRGGCTSLLAFSDQLSRHPLFLESRCLVPLSYQHRSIPVPSLPVTQTSGLPLSPGPKYPTHCPPPAFPPPPELPSSMAVSRLWLGVPGGSGCNAVSVRSNREIGGRSIGLNAPAGIRGAREVLTPRAGTRAASHMESFGHSRLLGWAEFPRAPPLGTLKVPLSPPDMRTPFPQISTVSSFRAEAEQGNAPSVSSHSSSAESCLPQNVSKLPPFLRCPESP